MTIATTTVPRRRRAAGPAGVGGSSWSAELEVVPVRLALARGGEWAAVELALRRGERDENRLTDLVFAGRHPERQGRPIAAGEQALAREWIEIRDHIVRPALAGRPAPSSDGRPAGGFRPIPVETPGGGRIQDPREPAAADRVTVPGLNGPITLHRLAADAWTAMVDAARADGIAAPLLAPVSGHRSVARQTELWKQALARYKTEQEARKWVAPPGSSAHHSGRALDLYLGGRNDSTNVSALRALPAYHWLQANAQRYGFYPYDREPWHSEYNPPAATQHELWTEAELPLPAPIRQLIDRGQEAAAIALALAQGQRDENKLTDLIFHTRHPERAGAPLTTNEHDLIREWLTIRDTTIRPLLTRTPTTTPTTPGPADRACDITYAPEPGREYGPRFRSTPPHGLPPTARHASRSEAAIPHVDRIARPLHPSAVFLATVKDLARTESGAMFARPANTFDARPPHQRPTGKPLITAWGVFQFNRPAWRALPEPASDSSPWECSPCEELLWPLRNYADHRPARHDRRRPR